MTHNFELEINPSPQFPEGKTLDFGQLSIEKLKDGRPLLIVRNPKTGVLFFNGVISASSTCDVNSDGKIKIRVTLMPMNSFEDCYLTFEQPHDR